MANTTDMAITCFIGEEKAISKLCDITEYGFLKISDGKKCGGHKIVCFETYAMSYKCIGRLEIERIVRAFRETDFDFPELAFLVVSCDNNEDLDGIYLHNPEQKPRKD